jgi:hypothetical protein
MRKKKAKVVIAPVCDFCGQRSETFVVNAEHKTFCLIQTPGYPAEKDCMDDYIRRNKNAKTLQKEKESSLRTQQKISFQNKEKKEIVTNKKTALKKLDELRQFLNNKNKKSFQKTPSL